MARRYSYSDYRRLSPSELEKIGKTRKSRHYILKSVGRLTKRTPTISARKHETLRTQQEYGIATPEIASKAREHGGLAYKTGVQEERVNKAKETNLLKTVKRGEGAQVSSANPSRKARGGFKLTKASAVRFQRNRERKLRGEYISDGEWHEMMDIAVKFKDSRIAQLRASPPASYTIGK
jgi:hypothetical protein